MIRALYVPLALGALLAFAAPASGQTITTGLGGDDCPLSIGGKCYSCPDNNFGDLTSTSCKCQDGSKCTVVTSGGKTAADKTKDAATTAAEATKDAADTAAAEATEIASGVTAAASSASFATGASAVFGAAMVLMA